MASKSGPRWCKRAEERVSELVETFRTNLRRIALRLGSHDRADTLDVRHVDEAFQALSRAGLQRSVWWKRPQLKVTVAAALAGVGMSAPDFAPHFVPKIISPEAVTPFVWVTVIVSFVLAIWLYSWAWFQDRL